MKIFIATPAMNGMFYSNYFVSALATQAQLRADGHEVMFYTLSAESLIPRARNKCAMAFLESDYDKLMFIDADIGWKYADLKLLMESDKKIIGGTYAIKQFPIRMNFNPLMQHYEVFGRDRSMDAYRKYVEAFAAPNGEVEVRHLPTGFMMIDRSVIETLCRTESIYVTPKGAELSEAVDLFPAGVVGSRYESEDWGFCRIAREMNFPAFLQSRIICSHMGNMIYKED